MTGSNQILHILKQGQWQPALPSPKNSELIVVSSGFLNSFTGKFRDVLISSVFKIQTLNTELTHGATGEKAAIAGKCFVLTHERWGDYKQLLAKRKQLAYRLRKLYPHFQYLWLQDPKQQTSVLIELESQKSLEVFLK